MAWKKSLEMTVMTQVTCISDQILSVSKAYRYMHIGAVHIISIQRIVGKIVIWIKITQNSQWRIKWALLHSMLRNGRLIGLCNHRRVKFKIPSLAFCTGSGSSFKSVWFKNEKGDFKRSRKNSRQKFQNLHIKLESQCGCGEMIK